MLMFLTLAAYVVATVSALLNGLWIQQSLASLLGIVALLSVFFLVALGIGFRGWQTLKNELENGRVQKVEGTVGKSKSLHRTRGLIYQLRIQRLTFDVGRTPYELIQEQKLYRIYYLPSRQTLLSFEQMK
jgi:hypothetical protein